MPVRLLVMVVPREARDDAEAALEAAGAIGFTEIPTVFGEGATGPRFGSRTAPGVSDLILAAVEQREVEPLRAALRTLGARLGRKLHAFLLTAEEV